MQNIKTLKLIAIYARVSTSAQEVQETIKTQIGVLEEHANKNGYTIVKRYYDDGWSGDVLNRPMLDQLRIDVKNKLFEAVLIYDPDRLARRYSYQELVMDELREAGIEVMFITVSTPKNSEDKILHGVRGLFAEYERAKISERFRLGKLRKVKEGHLLVSEALYGYHYVVKLEKVHGYYQILESEANVVRKIFSWVADEALTLRKVVLRLQELGIKPRKSKRGVWSTSTLSTLIRNKAYIGEARWGSSYAVVPDNPRNKDKYKQVKKSSRRIKPESEWIASKIPVTPIVDRVLFDRANEQLKSNFALCQRNKKNEYLLGGRIYCSCGMKRTGEGPQKGKFLYYRCNNRVQSFPLPATCFEKGINARIADHLVWENISELMSSSKLMNEQIERWSKTKETKTYSPLGDLEASKKEISKLKDHEDRYAKAYGAGVFSIEQLKGYMEPLTERIRILEAQIATIQQDKVEAEHIFPNEKEIEIFAKENEGVLGDLSFILKKDIILNVVEKIIATQEDLKVTGHVPITSPYVKYKTIDRHRRSTKRRKIDAF